MEKTKTVIIREFPTTLHAEFKSLCALVPVAMNRKIIEMVEAFVGDHHETIRCVRERNKK